MPAAQARTPGPALRCGSWVAPEHGVPAGRRCWRHSHCRKRRRCRRPLPYPHPPPLHSTVTRSGPPMLHCSAIRSPLLAADRRCSCSKGSSVLISAMDALALMQACLHRAGRKGASRQPGLHATAHRAAGIQSEAWQAAQGAQMLALLKGLARGTSATSATATSAASSRRSHARAASARSGRPCALDKVPMQRCTLLLTPPAAPLTHASKVGCLCMSGSAAHARVDTLWGYSCGRKGS